MVTTSLKFGCKENTSLTSGVMPRFISNSMDTDANATQSSRVSNYGVLDQYLGFRVGDAANITQSPLYNPTVGRDLQPATFNKSIASANTNISAALSGSQGVRLQKGPQLTGFGAQHENWGESNMGDSSSRTDTSTDVDPDERNQRFEMGQPVAVTASDTSDRSKEKTLDPKHRMSPQNREAARKSRLRKKAYVQQLENSRLKLSQLEQELQRARQQGSFTSGAGDQSNAGSGNRALTFGMEYARWREEQNRRIDELRKAVNAHASDTELRTIVDGVAMHFNEIFQLKGNAAKTDVFHILSGMWKTPAERCFMWIGGFRPSELLKLLVNQLEPLTEQQLTGIQNLQQSSHQAEDALSQGMEALQQSLAETIANGSSGPEGSSGNAANYMGQMAMAMGKLGTLEGFLRQADNLRQQTLQQMHRLLTTRQSARALLLVHYYFSRLRALSSLWLARPQE